MQRHPLDEPLLTQSLLGVTSELTQLSGADAAADAGVRAVVVAADPLVRAAFSQRLSRHAVAQSTGQGLASEVRRARANVVLWDLGPLPNVTLSVTDVSVPIVALTSTPGAAARLLAAGAQGVLRRDASVAAILGTLGTVRHGLRVVDPALVGGSHGEPRIPAAERPTEALTTREIEVLELVATGMSNKQIAADLGISAHTVKFHVNAILAKLDVHTRTQAVVRGVQLGVVVV